jgi:hypothetical protein
MKNTLTLLIIILISTQVEAQFIKEKLITAQIGYGLSAPYNSADEIVDSGFFMQGELVLKVASWVEIRPYAGLILTSSNGISIIIQPKNWQNQKPFY